jgi:peptidoglycan/LPS O-acetylase OafA/YrhL
MVVTQHTLGQFSADLGFVGVGLFFGLSGYLITSLLLDEYAVSGTVSLSRFYLRRAARLFPALILVLLVCDAIFVMTHDYGPIKSSVTAVTYTSNYAMVFKGDFVAGYGPTWSLAVEEHFYLLWPLMLLGICRRRGLRTALKATLAVCFGALCWRGLLAIAHVPYPLLGVGSGERADALLYGCAAAIAVRLAWRPRPWVIWVGISVVGILPFLFTHESYVALVVGNAVLAIAAAAVVVGLDYAAPEWLRRILSTRPIVAVGVLSYGIYLWHGPVMRIAGDLGYAGRRWRAVAVLVSIVAAGLSQRYVEKPVRFWVRRRTAGSLAPASASLIPDG